MLFRFEVKDDFFSQTYGGEIESVSHERAEQEIKEMYAYELGATEDEIEIIKLERVE
jgi:hypothetical protein